MPTTSLSTKGLPPKEVLEKNEEKRWMKEQCSLTWWVKEQLEYVNWEEEGFRRCSYGIQKEKMPKRRKKT